MNTCGARFGRGCKVKNIFVMSYSPKVPEMQIDCRPSSSFLYILQGEYRYTFGNTEFIASAGSTVYLPKRSAYRYSVISKQTRCIQVTFDIETDEGENTSDILFAKVPAVLNASQNSGAHRLFDALQKYFCENDEFAVFSVLYGIIARFNRSVGQKTQSAGDMYKIMPAVEYLNRNFTEKIRVDALAEMCGISQSHLRRLFIKHIGLPPIGYKNRILAETARNLIKSENMNVSEIAYSLNFSDIYTFSQFFKKETGISPKKYAALSKSKV